MKLAVLIDALDSLKPHHDTSLGMLKSAQARGWETFYFTLEDLYTRDGRVFASLSSIEILDESLPIWARVSAKQETDLSSLDLLLMRKDPPFDLEYIYATYALDLLEKTGVLIANKPQSLRDVNEKFFIQHFPQCCTPTLVSKDEKRLKTFFTEHKNVIFKPLAGMGGASVFHIKEDGQNLNVILETLTQKGKQSIMAQKYIAEISETGDKRILMVHGKAIPFALKRTPMAGESRANMAAGGSGQVVELNARDHFIANTLGPTLLEKGLYFVGLDVIGDYLTEINVTSPTCCREIEAETGLDISGDFLDGLARAC